MGFASGQSVGVISLKGRLLHYRGYFGTFAKR